MFLFRIATVLAITVAATPAALAQGAAPGTGEALYDLHCSGCHSAQVHWRDNKLATNWATLRAQVRRWQGNQNLQWSDGDIDAVSRHLNTLYYRYPVDGNVVGLATEGSSPRR